jgi:hypothetical protein
MAPTPTSTAARINGQAPAIATPRIERLPLSRLTVDHTVQREHLDHKRAGKMAAEFDENAMGVLAVSRRTDGTEKILDGMHRQAAAEIAGRLDMTVDCKVYTGLTLAQEAKMFRLLNNTAKPMQLDLFRTRVTEGDPTAAAITKLLARHGWTVRHGKADGSIAAVVSIERCWNADRFALDRAIATITAAWGHTTAAADGRIVEGLSLVYGRYGDLVDANTMADKLAKSGTPARLIGTARSFAQIMQTQQPLAVAETLVGLYNKARKTRLLPDWRSA